MSTCVIKLGGELLAPARADEAAAIVADVASLVARGDTVVIVHGGGPQTSALQRSLGQEPNIVGGRRITDDAALDAIKMMVGGKLNIELCARLGAAGVRAVGLTGASARAVAAVKRPPRVVSGCGDDPVDFGHVGDVAGLNDALLSTLIGAGFVPVLASLGGGDDGRVYNINADIVATQVAALLDADALALVTGTPGVLRDIADPDSRIRRATVAEARALIADGTVAGGMIPKLEESFNALAGGVHRVQVIGHLGPKDLLMAIDEPGTVGTTLVP